MNKFVEAEQERLTDILYSWSEEFGIEVEDQAQLSAARFLARAGQKFTFTGEGYFISAMHVTAGVITKLLDDGWITLAEKAIAPEEEKAERKAKDAPTAEAVRPRPAPPGQYV